MEKLLRVEHSVGGALFVGYYFFAKKVVCGVYPAEKAMMSLINDRIIYKVDCAMLLRRVEFTCDLRNYGHITGNRERLNRRRLIA